MFTLTITTDNDAFAEDPATEVFDILQRACPSVAADLRPGDRRVGANEGTLRDSNGNTVGGWKFHPDEDAENEYLHDARERIIRSLEVQGEKPANFWQDIADGVLDDLRASGWVLMRVPS